MRLGGKIQASAPYVVWIFYGYSVLHYSVEIRSGGHSFKTGDWLLNYSGGPIRRGLVGALLQYFSGIGVPLLWATFVLQVVVMGALFGIVLKIYKLRSRSNLWLLILFSPAFLLFPFYDLNGGFRKEILGLTIFAYACLIYAQNSVTRMKLVAVVLCFAFASFSHEVTVFMLPLFTCLAFRFRDKGLIKTNEFVVFTSMMAVIGAASLGFALLYSGGPRVTEVICKSLTGQGLDPTICNGAIAWSADDFVTSVARVGDMLGIGSLSVPLLLLIALTPLFFTSFFDARMSLWFGVALITLAPLFVVAIDWGRWVYVAVFLVFCLALSEEVAITRKFTRVQAFLGVVYLISWSIPHCCVGGGAQLGVDDFGQGLAVRVAMRVSDLFEKGWTL